MLSVGHTLPGMMSIWKNLFNEHADSRNAVGTIRSVVRDRINAARVICVLMMMYVHVPSGQQTDSATEASVNTRLDHWLESILIEGPGRASAALLSIVSGYLVVYTLTRIDSSVFSLYKRRFTSIVVPMFLWALLTCLVYAVLDHSSSNFVSAADTWHDKLNLVLFVYEAPYGPTLHLGFLRDLFVCVLLSPFLLFAVSRLPKITIGLLAFIYLFEHSGQLYIILRPLVILGFTIGMLLALRGTRLDVLDEYWPWFMSLTGVFAVLIIWTNAGLLSPLETYLAEHRISLKETILYPLCRLFGSLAIWCVLPMLKGVRMTQLSEWFMPYLFAAFCSHFLVLSLLFNGLWMPLAGDRDSYAYFLWFISAPLVAMAVAIVIVRFAARIFPLLAVLITGGRIPLKGRPIKVGGKLAQAT